MNLLKTKSKPLFLGTVFVCLLVGLSHITTHPNSARAELEGEPPISQPETYMVENDSAVSCRYGVTINGNDQTSYLADLGAGWFANFNVNFGFTAPGSVEYVPTVRLQQQGQGYIIKGPPLNDEPSGLGSFITANPGLLWLIGNEVDRVDIQDPTHPTIYARAYHDIYHFIKQRDPSAQVANSGLVQVTPGRLQYLEIVWDTYLDEYGVPMPVDVWNMHLYILPEARINEITGQREPSSLANIAIGTDINLAKLESQGTAAQRQAQCPLAAYYCYAEHDNITVFAEQVVAMRQWMKEHGQQEKPLIITEYSQLYPYDASDGFLQDEFGNSFTPQRVSAFMIDSFNYLETAASASLGLPWDNNRLVQQWLWYTVRDEYPIASSSLVNRETGLYTQMGTTYKNEVAKRPLSVNLLPEKQQVGFVVHNTTVADIAIALRNNGSTAVTAPFTVTFYADVNLTQVIGDVVIPAGLGGCARSQAEAMITWTGLQPGLNKFWALIDSGSNIAENKADNLVQGFVLVDPEQTFLPIIMRN